MPAGRLLAVVAPRAGLALLALSLAPVQVVAQVLESKLWGANGPVVAIARHENTLFIGGHFSAVGPCMGGGVALDRSSGAPLEALARVTGRVRAVVPDGAGGWFIGGTFKAVAGVPRAHLAHVRADGTLSPWNPGVTGGAAIRIRDPGRSTRHAGVGALALAGDVLYVGGMFDSVGGAARSNLAAVDATTGDVLDWIPDPDAEVRCLAAQGKVVYAGGEFDTIGGQARRALAALDRRTGAATEWDPHPVTAWWMPARVRALVVQGRRVVVGGDFDEIAGVPRNSVATLDVVTGKATEWDAGLGPRRVYIASGSWKWPYVGALAVRGNTIYVGGWFETAQAWPRPSLASFEAEAGTLTDFAPAPGGGYVNTLAAHGNTVFVGGAFQEIGGAVRANLAALDASTGAATAWDPRADGVVETIAVEGSAVYTGGAFGSVYDWQPRKGVAALDLTTGRVTPWNPDMDGSGILSLGVIDRTLYMLGTIRSIDGQPRGNLAAVDARTGAVTDWNPGGLNPYTWPPTPFLVADDSVVYAGSNFRTLGGQPRSSFAALHPATGAATDWAPQLQMWATTGTALLPHGDVVYLGGIFDAVGGEPRDRLAAVDSRTGDVLPWDPKADAQYIMALAAEGDRVYVGGTLQGVGGEYRSDLAAVDAVSGAPLPWTPIVSGDYLGYNTIHVRALAVRGGIVWAGGDFLAISGLPRPYLAALDGTSGMPLAWQPGPDGGVHVLVLAGDTLYVGGQFKEFDGLPRSGLAAVVWPSPALASRVRAARPAEARNEPALELGPIRQDPGGASARIAFSIASAASVALSVFDLQGRRIAAPLDDVFMAAGRHELSLDTAGWKSGIYFCRLRAYDVQRTGRMVVTR